MNTRPAKSTCLSGLVLASFLILASTPSAFAIPRNTVEMGDPDIGNKSQPGPGEASVSPQFTSSSVTKDRTSLWLAYLRLLISTRMGLR
jgi:hypothetical protein